MPTGCEGKGVGLFALQLAKNSSCHNDPESHPPSPCPTADLLQCVHPDFPCGVGGPQPDCHHWFGCQPRCGGGHCGVHHRACTVHGDSSAGGPAPGNTHQREDRGGKGLAGERAVLRCWNVGVVLLAVGEGQDAGLRSYEMDVRKPAGWVQHGFLGATFEGVFLDSSHPHAPAPPSTPRSMLEAPYSCCLGSMLYGKDLTPWCRLHQHASYGGPSWEGPLWEAASMQEPL